jgi:hypothetical protein
MMMMMMMMMTMSRFVFSVPWEPLLTPPGPIPGLDLVFQWLTLKSIWCRLTSMLP